LALEKNEPVGSKKFARLSENPECCRPENKWRQLIKFKNFSFFFGHQMTAFFHCLILVEEQCAVLSRCKLRTFYSFLPTGHRAFAESINRVAATATGVFGEKGKKTRTGAQFIIWCMLPCQPKAWDRTQEPHL
jgi:hypothetical protein